ncbi:MAG: nucleotide exchange factor GrpE [Nitrospiraceae bacterium]|nr:nucleotide exchange factor GrpE [Nitrospiraceae bacterium]
MSEKRENGPESRKGRAGDRELDPDLTPEQEFPAEGAGDEGVRLSKEIEELRRLLEQKSREAEEAKEKNLRTYADFENYRKRMQRDLAEFRKYANEQLALDLLSVVDHLGLALRHAEEGGEATQGLRDGVQLVYKQLRDVLDKHGVKPFEAAGEPFDPRLHDAMMQVEDASAPENTVVQVLQDGYRYHEKILRHAKVGVSKRPSGAPCAPAGAEPGGDDEDLED